MKMCKFSRLRGSVLFSSIRKYTVVASSAAFFVSLSLFLLIPTVWAEETVLSEAALPVESVSPVPLTPPAQEVLIPPAVSAQLVVEVVIPPIPTPVVIPQEAPVASPIVPTPPVADVVLVPPVSTVETDARISENDEIDKQIARDNRDFSDVVKQTTEYTCGPAALSTLINLMGGKTEEMEIARLSGTTEEKGTTMLGLKKAASEFGYSGVGKKIQFSKITKESLPFIVKIVVENEETKELKDHFVVLKKIEGDNFFVADPVDGNIVINKKDFEKMYRGSIFSVTMTKNSEILDPISGEIVKLKNLSQESALALIEEMNDDEMNLESGKFAALLRLLPPAIRAVIASTSFKVTASFVSDLAKHRDRLVAYSKIGIVAKKGKSYYDVTSSAIVKIHDDYLIMYGKDSNALMNAYKISSKTLKSKLKQGHWIKK